MVEKKHKITNVPLLLKAYDVIFVHILAKQIIGDFEGFIEVASTFFDPQIAPRCAQVKKCLGPLENPLEMTDYVFCLHKK
jgi:hypothetical protein